MKHVLNLGHPFTAGQIEEIGAQFGVLPANCLHVAIHLGDGDSPAAVIQSAFDEAAERFGFAEGLGDELDWQDVGLILPGFSVLAAIAVAHHEGRAGSLPDIITLVKEGMPPTFHIGQKIWLGNAKSFGAFASQAAEQGGREELERSQRSMEHRHSKSQAGRGRRKADSLTGAMAPAGKMPAKGVASATAWHKPGDGGPDGPDDI